MNNKKTKDLTSFAIGLAILILLNVVSNFQFWRLDLTAEKRYTLSDATVELLEGLDDYVYFKVYLEGEFPAGFQRLSDETRRMLNEFRAYSEYVEFEFINPSDNPDREKRIAVYRQLQSKGLEPTTLQVSEGEERSEKVIFPGAIATYQNNDYSISLLNNSNASNPEVILNNSIQLLEFELANAINVLQAKRKPSIGLVKGHGELEEIHLADITQEWEKRFTVNEVDLREFVVDTLSGGISINQQLNKLLLHEILVVAKPTKAFTDLDLFLLDQYLMHGGKMLWLVDAVHAEMDSLAQNNEIITFPNRELNIEQMLFRYGARVNYNLILDRSAAPILVPESNFGGTPQWTLRSWPYFPMVRGGLSDHPVVKNVAPLRTEFASSVDTIIAKGVKKEFLLFSSAFTKLVSTPNRITLDILNQPPSQAEYNREFVPVAVALNGKFTSFYKNGIPKSTNGEKLKFREESKPTRMVVVGDGDIIKNQVHRGEPYPLGIDKWTYERTRIVYGNKAFLNNAVDYLLDDQGLIEVRSKQLQLRILNRANIQEDKVGIQIINLLVPILSMIVLGLMMTFYRKKRFAKKIN